MMDVYLKPGKERPVRLGHPWVFSGAIRDLDPSIEPGTIVRVRSAAGELLGTAYLNPGCDIALRFLSRQDVAIDPAFLRARVAAALGLRRATVESDSDAYRLINAEGDGLPGFLVDRYASFLVLQCLTAGAERLKPLLVDALREEVQPGAIYERSEGSVRAREGLRPAVGPLFGEIPETITICENGLYFEVAPAAGQKTGLFLDQRPNHRRARALAAGRTVLDAFSYNGAFALHAAAGGAARVVAVDSSRRAVAAARANAERNRLSLEVVEADVPRFLRESGDDFDLVILDPPALVRHRKDIARGARAYKDLHLWALRRTRPAGLVLTFSCSQHIGAALFRKIVAGAAADVGRAVRVLGTLGPGPDHPVAVGHPEGEYLHGLLLAAD